MKSPAFTHFLLAVFLALAPQAASAQALVLKDNSRVQAEDFAVEGGKIIRTVRMQGGASATAVLAPANIAELDWPYAAEIAESRALLSQGKTVEAIEVLKTGTEFFEVFKDVKGGVDLYRDTFYAYVQALAQGGRFDDTIRLVSQVEKLPLTSEQQLGVKVLKLDIERQTSSDYTAILAQANNILSDTDDSAISAAVWTIIGDVHDRRKEWEKALMAYLRIPVFFGTQMQRVPEAELNAARMLVKMRRFGDAQVFFNRLIESYPGSAIAETAAKEKAAINGMANEDSPAPASAERNSQS